MLQPAFFATWTPRVLALLRIMVALLVIEHGTQKLFGFPMRPNGAAAGPAMFTMYWFAAIIELVGGALVFLGLFTRCAAFILAGELAFAYFISHAPRAFFPILNGGDAAVLFCFAFFFISFAGPGSWAIDKARS